jgi:hypothetical protein
MVAENFKAKLKPNIGVEALSRIKSNLIDINNYGGIFDFNKALLSTKSFLSDKTVVFIVSDFFNLKKSWESYVNKLSVEYELIALVIRDPRDRFIPEGVGQILVKDPLSGENTYVDTAKIREEYNKSIENQEKYLKSVFKKSRGDYLLLSTDDENYVMNLIRFFQERSVNQV